MDSQGRLWRPHPGVGRWKRPLDSQSTVYSLQPTASDPRYGIEPVVVPEFFVEAGMPVLELSGFLKKGLGCNGKEFNGIRSAIGIHDGLLSLGHASLELLEFRAQNTGMKYTI